jgi:hypothetical protein
MFVNFYHIFCHSGIIEDTYMVGLGKELFDEPQT